MFAQVIPVKRGKLSLPFFDYSVTKELEAKLKIGQLVTIPLRSRTEFGVIRSFSETSEAPTKLLRPISGIVHEHPFVSTEQLAFLEEMGELYHTSLGSVIKSALPPLQKRKLKNISSEITLPKKEGGSPEKPRYRLFQNEREREEFYTSKKLPPNEQILILVPEVPDCETIAKYFDQERICIISSYLSDKEFYSCWMEVWTGKKDIIVGTRRALFMSFNNLKEIIVEQEAHPSHKSWDQAPRFNTRDAAIYASRHYAVPVTLTASMPSVETYYFAKHGVYSPLTQLLPSNPRSPHLINMRSEHRAGNFSSFSYPVQEAIEEHQRGSIFLFCNRRGSASYVMCRDCANVLLCSSCKRPMTFHESLRELHCHHCSTKEPMHPVCKKCNGANLAYFGLGTEAIAKEYRKLFPYDKRDIVEIEGSETSLRKLDAAKNQVIVGTQIAWPHLNWKNISLMVFMDADTPLFVPEYLSSERVWLSIHDAIFRLPSESTVFLQSSRVEERIFAALSALPSYYEGELSERKMFGYPPFKFLLKLFFGSNTRESVKQETEKIYTNLALLTKNSPDITINRPIELFPYFTKGNYWQAIILKLAYKNYKKLLRGVLKNVPESWKVDPNPTNLLNP